VLAFFRVNPAKSFNQPDFFIRSACCYQSSGQPRVNPGKQKGGGREKNKKNRRVFFSRYLAANDALLANNKTGVLTEESTRSTTHTARSEPLALRARGIRTLDMLLARRACSHLD